jgi:hypothetical protein
MTGFQPAEVPHVDTTALRLGVQQAVEEAVTAKVPALKAEFAEALVALAKIVEAVPGIGDFAHRERAILAITNELGRQLISGDLQRTANSFPDEVTVKEQRYRRHSRGAVTYHSLCGDVVVHRDVFRRVGVHNGDTVVPLDLSEGLVHNTTPALGYCVSQGIADMPTRLFEETMRAMGRRPPSRSTVTRLANGFGGCLKQDINIAEAVLQSYEPLPAGANAIAVGLDRTTVPMAEEVPDEDKPRKRPLDDYVREPPQPVEVRYRMAYVGTVSVLDREGQALRTWRFGATAEEGSDEIVRRMMAQVTHLRGRMPSARVAIVQDGAPELWGVMWDGLRSIGVTKWINIIDRFHVTEHMNAALDLARIKDKNEIRQKYIGRLENSDRVVGAFARWLFKTFRGQRAWRDIAPHCYYLESAARNGWTRYATMRRLGLPTASGVTEGACKSVVAMRFKRSGQRWQQDGLTAILTLRTLRLSDRLPGAWVLLRRRFTAIVQC